MFTILWRFGLLLGRVDEVPGLHGAGALRKTSFRRKCHTQRFSFVTD